MDKVIIDGVDVSIPVKLRPNRTDLTGKKFGKLTVIKPVISAKIGRKAHSRWLCQCECGNYKVAYTYSLLSGNTRSCGCLSHKPNTYVKRLKAENEFLKKELEKHKSMIAHNLKPLIDSDFQGKLKELEQENERLKARLRPLEDSYFNGLSTIEIAELAKKSTRITAENRKLEDALQEIREYCKEQNLKADYTACEIIDKINSVIGAEE